MAGTAEVQYVGRYQDGVDVHMPDGNWKHVPYEGVLATTEEHAVALLTQEGEWQSAKSPQKTKKED